MTIIAEDCVLAAIATKTETIRRGRRPPQHLQATSILLSLSPPHQHDSYHNRYGHRRRRRHPTAPQDRRRPCVPLFMAKRHCKSDTRS